MNFLEDNSLPPVTVAPHNIPTNATPLTPCRVDVREITPLVAQHSVVHTVVVVSAAARADKPITPKICPTIGAARPPVSASAAPPATKITINSSVSCACRVRVVCVSCACRVRVVCVSCVCRVRVVCVLVVSSAGKPAVAASRTLAIRKLEAVDGAGLFCTNARERTKHCNKINKNATRGDSIPLPVWEKPHRE